MEVSIVIDAGESRYEVFFDIEDGAAASDRLGGLLGEIEKRFVKRRAREASAPKPKSQPQSPISSSPGGVK